MTHGRLTWVRRLSFAAVLVAAAVTPGLSPSGSSAQCPNQRCRARGTVRWARSLPGSWVAQNGMTGTTPEQGQAFAGALSLAFGGVVLFADASAVRAYSETTGRLLWHYRAALPDTVDAAAGRLYLISGNTLVEVNPVTGRVLAHVAGAAAASSSGLYAVRDGDVLGIDHGAVGKAWGYNDLVRDKGFGA